MGAFTFIPEWAIQDIVIFVCACFVCAFILKHEERPGRFFLEFVCFCLLYAAVYENFATLMKWYGYGRSILMVGNVPLSIPIVEYLVVYAGLRLADAMRLPTWAKPFFVGFQAMIFDFSLDPVSIKLIRDTLEGRIGRWSWYPRAQDVQILGEPVYNFTGWILLAGWAAAFFLLGRAWWTRSKNKALTGALYPVLSMLCALGVLVSPTSQFLIWFAPFFKKGGVGEWIMLGAYSALTLGILVFAWKGRMRKSLDIASEWPVYLVFGGFHLMDLGMCFAPGGIRALPLVLGASLAQWAMLVLFRWRGKKAVAASDLGEGNSRFPAPR